jgi:hypothetical protein
MLDDTEKNHKSVRPCGKVVTAAALNRFRPVGFDHLLREAQAVGLPWL